MRDWFSLFGEQYADAVFWTLAALVLLVVILFVVRIFRKVGPRAFSSGGRNRPRLGVTDSVAVDNQRRLVLVRRDDVEHLILIGGPGDVVVEQDIRPNVARPRVPQPEPALRPVPTAPVPSAPAAPPVNARQEPVLRTDTAPQASVKPETLDATVSSAALQRQNGPSPERTMAAQQGQSASQPSSRRNEPATPARDVPHQATQHAQAAEVAPAATFPATRAENTPAAPQERVERPLPSSQNSGDHAPEQTKVTGETQSSADNNRSRSEIDDEMSKLLDNVSDEKR